jgi:alkanesulfonate monooxygenase SsuD/methylene tetrahydromethanopterin reductase-like flavin-dependent oxidoreductase (luciferase family)
VIAGINVIAADSEAEAAEQFDRAKRARVRALVRPGRRLTDAEVDAVLASPDGRHIVEMMRYSAVGRPADVREYLETFADDADADELIVALPSPTPEARLHSAALLATELIR